ncbi:hypothetical protein SS50377_27231 [Spironucleus salmonicida]|uniref:Uncharacterized protein n=1 Tax=Spironucleus salmonicida TaxID=348837 RepID=V6M6C4_9EUKA|nr:hypothetical protein SS50377_27215 [Spironucleus salmonicida]KAH0570938.1 hypothetical protein SS50377_27231 [Spironucleus salmonicida]|eukprot:EST48949.1 Hypothetical protein SS50377_10793 [Spironucleus salmonicida]
MDGGRQVGVAVSWVNSAWIVVNVCQNVFRSMRNVGFGIFEARGGRSAAEVNKRRNRKTEFMKYANNTVINALPGYSQMNTIQRSLSQIANKSQEDFQTELLENNALTAHDINAAVDPVKCKHDGVYVSHDSLVMNTTHRNTLMMSFALE